MLPELESMLAALGHQIAVIGAVIAGLFLLYSALARMGPLSRHRHRARNSIRIRRWGIAAVLALTGIAFVLNYLPKAV